MKTTDDVSINNARNKQNGKLNDYINEYSIVLGFVFVVIVMTIARPNFLKVDNILNLLTQVSINGYLAIGMTCVILIGGIDLSVGSIVGLTGIVSAIMAKSGNYLFIVIVLAALLTGAVCGLINGIIISRFKVAPFIATLAMMSIARGITFIVSDGRPITGLSSSFKFLGSGKILQIPVPVTILFLVFILFQIILYHTKVGRHMYAVGGNEIAANISGINVKKVKVLTYLICGLFSGLAGIMLTARVTSGLPQAGQSYELDAIAAVIVGGTSMSGGKGKLWGTLIGVLLVGVLNNGLDLVNVSSYYQLVLKGLIIMCAVALDSKKNN